MALKVLLPKESMNKNVRAIVPLEDEKAKFQLELESFLSKLLSNPDGSEEHQKNLLADFLKVILQNNYINTKETNSERIDLAIYNGRDVSSTVGVIFETKRLTEKVDMMTVEKPNVKALQEAIAYYLTERIIENNLEVKKIIVTNGVSWFIIESKELEKYFYNNKKLREQVQQFHAGQLSGQNTSFLYDSVLRPEIDKAIEKGLTVTHFEFAGGLYKNGKIAKSQINNLYRFFSAENLLNKEIFTDSNKLNKAFYDELLYIMGLEEVKEGTSKVIARLKPEKRQYASLIENTIEQLAMKDVPKAQQFDLAIQLSVIWMNRILFLKLLESQLVAFNGNDESLKFLTSEKIPNFDELNALFFGVLARQRNFIFHCAEFFAYYQSIPADEKVFD